MAEIKGKFITLTGMLMTDQEDVLAKANEYLEEETGCTHLELDPEEYYDTKHWDYFMKTYSNASDNPKQAMIDLGKRIYPTIKRTAGFPEHLKTPLDFVKFEAEGYLANHNGDDVIPRTISDEQENEITMHAPAPGYDENLYIGVWLGILEMLDIFSGQVDELGNSTFRIHW